jgi:two-component system cell cycle response regulator
MGQQANLPDLTITSFVGGKAERRASHDDLDACLIVIQGRNIGARVVLDKEITVLGRSKSADAQIDEESVSRVHAVIRKRGGEFLITDQNSKNGTFVNSERRNESPLQDQDLIGIGTTVFKFIASDSLELAYHEELHKLATLDPMLRIFNKRVFLEQLDQRCRRLQTHPAPFVVILFDIDHFKRINDTYGHRVGDQVLLDVAATVRANLRNSDLFSRYGGEEFGVLLPGTSSEQAWFMAERLRRAVEATPSDHGGEPIRVTISLGIAVAEPGTAAPPSAQDLIEQADAALYQAKKAGRNRAVLHGCRHLSI